MIQVVNRGTVTINSSGTVTGGTLVDSPACGFLRQLLVGLYLSDRSGLFFGVIMASGITRFLGAMHPNLVRNSCDAQPEDRLILHQDRLAPSGSHPLTAQERSRRSSSSSRMLALGPTDTLRLRIR